MTSSTFLAELMTLAIRQGAPPPGRTVAKAQILDAGTYLETVMPTIESFLVNHAAQTHQAWAEYVGFSRMEDLQRVAMPDLIDRISRFAAKGQIDDGLHAISLVVYFVMRELLRQGELPILIPLESLESIPAKMST